MKKIQFFTLLLLIGFPYLTFAQEPKFVYCQIIATEKFLSNKVNIELDFGQKMKYFADNRLKDDKGKAITFNTNIDAMNYMGKQGWEFAQSSVVSVPGGLGSNILVYITVMKKPFSELDEESKKEYLAN